MAVNYGSWYHSYHCRRAQVDYGEPLCQSCPVAALDARPLFEAVDDLGDGPYVQLWPHRHGTDAMFSAALKVG